MKYNTVTTTRIETKGYCLEYLEATRRMVEELARRNEHFKMTLESDFADILLGKADTIVYKTYASKFSIGMSYIREVVEKYDGKATFETEQHNINRLNTRTIEHGKIEQTSSIEMVKNNK